MDPILTNPGDIVLVHRRHGFYSFWISIGQGLRFKGPKHFKYWTHIAIVVGDQGEIVEAAWPCVRGANLIEYKEAGADFAIADITPWADVHDREQVVAFAKHAIGTKYGIAEAASLGFWMMGVPVRSSVGNQLICSALGAEAASRTNIIFPTEPLWMTPAHHAQFFNIPGKS